MNENIINGINIKEIIYEIMSKHLDIRASGGTLEIDDIKIEDCKKITEDAGFNYDVVCDYSKKFIKEFEQSLEQYRPDFNKIGELIRNRSDLNCNDEEMKKQLDLIYKFMKETMDKTTRIENDLKLKTYMNLLKNPKAKLSSSPTF
jgi:hypothetical protein